MIAVIIEDNPTSADIICRQLNALGFSETHVSGTAEGGMELVQRVRPQFTIVDERLPDASGTELVRALRIFDPNLVVAMCTVIDDEATIQEAFEAGCNYYVVKPNGLQQLCRACQSPEDILNIGSQVVFS
ncbi:MAG: response regulator [Aggregatilineales bacterium]